MGRLYTVSFTDVAITAAQDLFGILATANMAFKVHGVELGQKSLTTWEAKSLKWVRNPATATVGSGGSAATPRPIVPGDVAATVTARVNDTTNQTTSGTQALIWSRDWEFLNGVFWLPAPEQRPVIAPGQGFALQLVTAPSASMTASGSVMIEELF
jgi:hypothetical protein